MALIAPSIVAADWARFGEALQVAASSGASLVHVDVMDGHFVPEISVGQPVVASLRKATELPLEVHLLVERPERYAGDFLKAGADRIAIHCEATHRLPETLKQIRDQGAKAGVAVLDATPLDAVAEVLGAIDFLTILCSSPVIQDRPSRVPPQSVEKIRQASKMRTSRRLAFAIEAEGGLGADSWEEVAAAGADILVAGSAIFKSADPRRQLAAMVRAASRIQGASVA
jgi:ribulose-phosphate 3-epimerase